MTPLNQNTFIAYYRQSSVVDGSEISVGAQRARLTAWVEAEGGQVAREFVEYEAGDVARPALASAVAECKRQGATLLIATTAPLRPGGEPFKPRIASVRVVVIPDPEGGALAEIIPVPKDAPASLALLFDLRGGSALLPVYLSNAGPTPLREVAVRSSGVTMNLPDGFACTSTATREVGLIPAESAVLVDEYDRQFDGDFILRYELDFVDADGLPRRACATVGNFGALQRWVPLRGRP